VTGMRHFMRLPCASCVPCWRLTFSLHLCIACWTHAAQEPRGAICIQISVVDKDLDKELSGALDHVYPPDAAIEASDGDSDGEGGAAGAKATSPMVHPQSLGLAAASHNSLASASRGHGISMTTGGSAGSVGGRQTTTPLYQVDPPSASATSAVTGVAGAHAASTTSLSHSGSHFHNVTAASELNMSSMGDSFADIVTARTSASAVAVSASGSSPVLPKTVPSGRGDTALQQLSMLIPQDDLSASSANTSVHLGSSSSAPLSVHKGKTGNNSNADGGDDYHDDEFFDADDAERLPYVKPWCHVVLECCCVHDAVALPHLRSRVCVLAQAHVI
jgi:hypothetical protein